MASLADTPLPRLLVELHRQGFEGWVTLERGKVRRRFLWQGGVPTRLESNAEGDALVEQLITRGLVGEDARTKVRRAMAAKPAAELAVLVGLKLAAPRDLLAAVGDQLRGSLLDAIAWESGTVSFEPMPAGDGAPPAAPVDVLTVAAEGVARTWRFDQVLQSLGDNVTHFPSRGASFDAVVERLPRFASLDTLLEGICGGESAFNLLRRVSDPSACGAFWLLDASRSLEWSSTATHGQAEEQENVEPQGPALPELEIVVAGCSGASSAKASVAASRLTTAQAEAKTEKLRQEILELHGQLGSLDYWALLGVEQESPAPEIKKAYLKLAKRLHPDKVAQVGLEDVKETANELFAEITRAHQVLADPDERRAYEASLQGHTTFDADRLGQAETLFRKGELLMNAGNFLGAFDLLEAAVQLWPEEADYQAALAWTLFKKNPPEDARAIEHFDKALALNGDNAHARLRLAVVLKATGDSERAAAETAKAQALDPNATV
ncbi:MAG: DnaJ domain-containing protein [Deltaproteobacteria bacterium]|nr:DnaJ domain-containing protein [Deltaproteobacteria bacterium]MBW2395773.1 DnaJ domain-containing protein [Deltaproteobacteria bacterium]